MTSNAMLHPLSPIEAAGDNALEAAGFKRTAAGTFCFGRGKKLKLTAEPARACWRRYVSAAIDLRAKAGLPPAERPAPPGPFKVIVAPDGASAVLVADFPLPLGDDIGTGLHDPAVLEHRLDPDHVWAVTLKQSLTALAGKTPVRETTPAARPSAAELVESLNRLDWRCHEVDGAVQVNLQGEHWFRKVMVRPDAETGTLLEMELARATDWTDVSHEAADAVAREANRSLRLVRVLTDDRADGPTVIAQVHLGEIPLSSRWLPVGLDALRATAHYLACEIPVLADPMLARWTLESLRHRKEA